MEEILHNQTDDWNPINNGMFTIYQLVIRISQSSTGLENHQQIQALLLAYLNPPMFGPSSATTMASSAAALRLEPVDPFSAELGQRSWSKNRIRMWMKSPHFGSQLPRINSHSIRMYAIYGNIYHQYTPNVSINLPYMDPSWDLMDSYPYWNRTQIVLV